MRNYILPLPPGINATYKIGYKKLVKSQAAKDWEEEAGYILIKEKNKIPMDGELRVTIHFFIWHPRDIDSVIKITLDLLERMQVFKNDSQVSELLITKQNAPAEFMPRMFIGVGSITEPFMGKPHFEV